MRRALIVTTSLTLLLAACGESGEAATQSPPETPAPSQPTGLELAEAQRATVLAEVAADTEECFLPDGVEREAQAIDLAEPTGGVGALIVMCSVGNRDVWNRLYVVTLADGLAHATPLIQYDIQGDGQWRRETITPNLEWNAERRQFSSSIRNGPTLCSATARWRWDPEARRIALVEQLQQDCDVADGEDLPAPRVIWPTTPQTPEPEAG